MGVPVLCHSWQQDDCQRDLIRLLFGTDLPGRCKGVRGGGGGGGGLGMHPLACSDLPGH